MNTIYIVRIPQECPKVDTIVYSDSDRTKCVAYSLESDYNECYLEEWRGNVVRVRNLLKK